VLVVDDKLEMAEMVADGLNDRGFRTVATASSREALDRLKAEHFDALITDLRMPEVDGLGLLAASKSLDPARPVLVMTAYGAVDSAISAIREGASHYLTKPFKVEELAVFLERALDEAGVRAEAKALKSALMGQDAPLGLVARSEPMRRILELVQRVAPTNATVLLLGETGTGKGHLARLLHELSPRAKEKLVTVNCAALPEPLLESELFGHAKGAFTGATSAHVGLFETAHQGTLFLDEVGEMSPALQAKLLHVLETGRIRGVGQSEERVVDVRVVAATHRDLRAQSEKGLFRGDLLYRLEVIAIEVPPLRNRPEDIPVLLEHFLSLAKARHPGSRVEGLSPGARRALLDYAWPGNVRELAHLVERVVLLSDGPQVRPEELPTGPRPPEAGLATPVRGAALGFHGEVVTVRELHHLYATWALARIAGNRSRAAERLGIDLKTLRKWLADTGGGDG
jgi:two-component system response regulator HydG